MINWQLLFLPLFTVQQYLFCANSIVCYSFKIHPSQLTKSHYKPKDIAEFLGVTTRTLQNWDKDGKINFRRDPVSDRRFLTKDDTITLLREHNLLYDDATDKRRDVIYARVSSHDQKSHGDLDRQIRFLIDQSDNLQKFTKSIQYY